MPRPKKTVEPTLTEKVQDGYESLLGARVSIGERDDKLYVLSEGEYNYIASILKEVIDAG